MNVKIQGGGHGKYANTGSCFGVISYLSHEDGQRLEQGEHVEMLFDQHREVGSREAVIELDANKAKLCKDEAKFYVITVSPSEAEIKKMGQNSMERSQNLRKFIREDLMRLYADNFGKGLTENDIKYFAKVHLDRGDKIGENMHAHIVVSRKDMSNTKKLSPMTNHRNTNKGVVHGGFDRVEFFKKVEQGFDVRFNFNREYKQSFEYLNAVKNSPIDQLSKQVEKAINNPIVQIEKQIAKQIKKIITKDMGNTMGW